MKRYIVTGAAGFIGSNLCDFLLAQGVAVAGIDNFSTGKIEFLNDVIGNSSFSLHRSDLRDAESVKQLFCELRPDVVIHLASNADVRFGLQHPRLDLEQGTIVTHNVLEASRVSGATSFAFASSGSVYGEPTVFPTPEECPFPVQTSLYGAAKLAGEGLVQAYAVGYGMKGYIFRFVSILGERYTHGHVRDFACKLLRDPHQIEVLGNGKQKKSYLYVGDCVSGIWRALEHSNDTLQIFNLGSDETCTVDQSLDIICRVMGVTPQRQYQGGARGWVGDSPFIFLDCGKIKATGWTAQKTIEESVKITLEYLLGHPHLLARGDE